MKIETKIPGDELAASVAALVHPYVNLLGNSVDPVLLGVVAGLAVRGQNHIEEAREALENHLMGSESEEDDGGLTPLEVTVSRLIVQKLTYKEISKKIARHSKSVDNALQRARAKIAKNPARMREVIG